MLRGLLPRIAEVQSEIIIKKLLKLGKIPLEHMYGIHNIGISNRYQSPVHSDNDVGLTAAISVKCV